MCCCPLQNSSPFSRARTIEIKTIISRKSHNVCVVMSKCANNNQSKSIWPYCVLLMYYIYHLQSTTNWNIRYVSERQCNSGAMVMCQLPQRGSIVSGRVSGIGGRIDCYCLTMNEINAGFAVFDVQRKDCVLFKEVVNKRKLFKK